MTNFKKVFLVSLLLLIVFAFSGCIDGEIKVSINEDGSIDLEQMFKMAEGDYEMMKQEGEDFFADMKEGMIEEGFEAEKFTEGGEVGVRGHRHIADPDKMEADLMGDEDVDAKTDINIDEGLFKTKYSLDFLFEGAEGTEEFGAEMMSDMFNIDFILELPEEPIEHNADTYNEDNNELIWNLDLAHETSVQASFEAWNISSLIAIGAGAIIVVGGGAFIAIKSKSDKKE